MNPEPSDVAPSAKDAELLALRERVRELEAERDAAAWDRAAPAPPAGDAKYQTLFDAMTEGFCVIEMSFDDAGKAVDYRFLEVNSAFGPQTGIAPEVVQAGTTMREIAEEHEERWFEIYGEVAKTGRAASFDLPAAALGRWYEVKAYRVGGEGSARVGVLFRDVTGEREAVRARREGDERYRAVFEALDEGFCVLEMVEDEEGRVVDYRFKAFNPAFEAQAGVPADLARRGLTIRQIAPGIEESWIQTYGRVAETGVPERFEMGSEVLGRYCEVYAFRLEDQANGDVAVVFKDVTDSRRAQERERAATETFRMVFEQAPDDAILVMGLDRTLTAWNPAAERITGWSAEEAVGQPADLIFTPEDVARGAPAWETDTAAREGKAEDERWHMRRDGSRFWGSGTMNALHDAEGSVKGFLKVFRDATERREAERLVRELNESLETRVEARTAELRRAVEEAEGFNYAISHDLRTPLRAIAMTSAVLMEEAGSALTPEHRQLLDRQGRASRRLGQLIDELLQLSRLARVELKRRPIDMTQEARTAAWAISQGREIEVQEGMVAEGDPGLVLSVWQNLIGNACKFSPSGGTILVGKEGGAFFVRDEGVGFDLRHASRIFLPFERLVADHEFPGTGIGLANVKRIVERHGGRVWAESAPGEGAAFFFTLGAEGASAPA